MKSQIKICVLLCLSLNILGTITTTLQVNTAPTVSYSIIKLNGFGGLHNDILGIFRIDAVVSFDVVRVEFYLDDQLVLNDTESPFQWIFNTADFSLGLHTFNITAYDNTGESASIIFTRTFIAGLPLWFIVAMISIVSLALAPFLLKHFWTRGPEEKPQ